MNKYAIKNFYNIDGAPLYAVEIRHTVLSSFDVFATEEKRAEYLKKELEELESIEPITEDKYIKAQGLLTAYSEAEYIRFFEDIATGRLFIDEEAPKPATIKKTLADLKRDAKGGKLSLEMLYRYGEEIPEKMKGARQVIDANTAAIKLMNHNGEISELRPEAAALIEYTPDTLTIYAAGYRELTQEEAAEMDRANEERKRYQEANPYSDSFWHMRAFWKNSRFSYLDGAGEYKQGKALRRTSNRDKIQDRSIKGNIILKYRVLTA